MTPRRRSLATETTSLSPEDADVLRLVQENLRLLSELRSRYRSSSRGGPNGRQIRSPQDIADLLAPEMEMLPQEQMRVILMDRRNRVVDVVMVYQGSVSTAVVRMAELFRDAIVANAPALILAHNHPSGCPEPSPEDIQMTSDAAQAAKLLSIDLLDHIVIGQGRFVSLKERGVL